MRIRALLLPGAIAGLALLMAGIASAASPGFYVASESYYRLDVPAGSMSVTVDAQVQSGGSSELKQIELWAMPAAANIAVKGEDGNALTSTSEALSDADGLPTLVTVTLAKPIKGGLKAKLTMTYDVPAQSSELVHMQGGAIDALFVSQGTGSFVFIDVPQSGDNYFEPGCLEAADQPGSVKDAGLERWVCGDATLIALNTDNPGVLRQCAELEDKCRQRLFNGPFSAFAQSITDTNLRGIMEESVPMQRGPVKLTLKYLRTDQAWAEKQFAVAKTALPRLEAVFGFPYPRDTIVMRESHFIEFAGAAGVAFPDQGEVLLTKDNGFEEEVTVHELAHQWAGSNLETSWLWEGLAEYGMRTLAPELGITPYDRKWQSWGYKDPLATWWNGSAVTNPDYWYGKAGAFWFAYQDAIGGPEKMRAVLGQLDDDPKRLPADGRWFMDKGEAASGANLDSLFLTWVYNPEASSALLAERRAAHDQVNALVARASEAGLSGTPVDIQQNLDAWTFGGIAAQVKKANSIVDSYLSVVALAKDAGLPASDGVAKAWGTRVLDDISTLVEDQRQAITSITSAAKQLADEPADSPALAQLVKAREKYAADDYAGAKQLASSSTTTAFNQVAAGKILEVAKAQQAAFHPSFLEHVGLLFSDPDAKLAKAEKAYAGGDPATAISLSRSAVADWDGASGRGLMYLAALAGVMAAVSLGAWWLLRRLDPSHLRANRRASGHVLGPTEERRGSWKDWENTP